MSTQNESIEAIKNQQINVMVSQLGGNRFMMMTGSKPQYKSLKNDPLIAFKLTKNNSKANYLTVTYVAAADTYKMDFVRIHGMNEPKQIENLENVYAEDLERTFASVTGLATRL